MGWGQFIDRWGFLREAEDAYVLKEQCWLRLALAGLLREPGGSLVCPGDSGSPAAYRLAASQTSGGAWVRVPSLCGQTCRGLGTVFH